MVNVELHKELHKKDDERENQQITESRGEYFIASNDLCHFIWDPKI